MLKEVVWNRLSSSTTWFHVNSRWYNWKHILRNPQKVVKNSLYSSKSICLILVSTIGIWTILSTMLKEVVWNQLSSSTTWFHIDSRLYNWKRILRNPQKVVKNSLYSSKWICLIIDTYLNETFNDVERSRLESIELYYDMIPHWLSIV